MVCVSLEEDFDNVLQALDSALKDLGVFVLVDRGRLGREKVLEDGIFIVEYSCRVGDNWST